MTIGVRHPESIAFSSFRLDLRSGQLLQGSTPVPLRPKTWSVLLYLIERPGELVSREDLLDAVWPNVAVTPDTLTKSIGELRRALGDDAATPRFIATVHRRGFRFIGAAPTVRSADTAAAARTHGRPERRPIVGRAAELERLADSLAKADAGERQIVFLTGAAGVGKTTLVDAFLVLPSQRQAAPPWVARGMSAAQHGPREPYMPVLSALERLARRPDAEILIGLLRRAAPTWLAQMPWLIGDDEEALRRSLRATRAERMLREFATLVEELTRDLTLVLVLEDLHWSDPATVDLLTMLAQRGEPARLLLIGTYRPAEVVVQEHALAQAVRTMHLRRQCSELPVHELTPADVHDYLAARFPGGAIPATLAARLHAHTDGTPLFVAAVVDHLVSRGWILDTAPGWSFAPALATADLGIPDDARRMIDAQFDSLAPADRSLLAAASVAGVEFIAQDIAASLRCELDDVETRCEALAGAQRFLRLTGVRARPEGATAQRFAFTHELYRQAVYEGIPAGSRQRLHQRIGEALETMYGARATEIAPELAAHFERGGNPARALHYLAAAADRARRRYAAREAIQCLEGAIVLAAQLPAEDDRRRSELELRLALAPLLNDLNGFASDELKQNCERALVLCAEVGSQTQRFQILYALCHVHVVRADPILGPSMLGQLDDLARRLGTVEHRLLVDSALARSHVMAGNFAEACSIADGRFAAQLHAEASTPPFAYGADLLIDTSAHHAYALWFLGYPARARDLAQATLARAARDGVSPYTRAAATGLAAALAILCRDADDVLRLGGALRVLSEEHGFRFWHAIAQALYGWARVQHGDPHAGLADIERARAAHAATGARLFSTQMLAFLAEAHLRMGNWTAGLTNIDEGLRVAETTLDRAYWPELWRLKGELLMAAAPTRRAKRPNSSAEPAGEPTWNAAETCLQRALDLARGNAAKGLELRAATSLARAWQRRGRATEARQLLDGICAWFADAPAGADLRDARDLLDRPRFP